MRSYILLLLILGVSYQSFSQSKSDNDFKICNSKKIYSVDNHSLEDYLGKDFKKVKRIPVFNDRKYKLTYHFRDVKLKDKKLKGQVLRVHLGFVINCEGKPGNFIVLNDVDEKYKIGIQEVLDLAKKMPETWTPGVYKKKDVDCYQVLTLTIFDGNISNVFWVE